MIASMRRLALGLVLAALGIFGYLILGWTHRGAGGPEYVTAPVDRGPITPTVAATGTVNPVTTVQVGTYVSGPIQAIYADFNTPVRRGQLLARIDPRPFQVKVDDATAALANARAQLDKDRADAALRAVTLERTRSLRGGGIVSASDLDLAVSLDRQARAQVALDEAQIQSAEAKLREAQVNLDYTEITSPVDGVVVARNVAVGQTVAATFQTPTLFLVAGDLAKMAVDASVSESDIGDIAPTGADICRHVRFGTPRTACARSSATTSSFSRADFPTTASRRGWTRARRSATGALTPSRAPVGIDRRRSSPSHRGRRMAG